jgi:sortase A
VKAARSETGVGEPAGWISIPSIGIETIVLMGDTKENLQRYPCLSRRSVAFSEPGFVKVVAAHRDTHFRRLGEVSTGDRVRIMLKDRRVLTYSVCDREVVAREMAERRVAEKDGGDWLVLMTCHPFTFTGAAPERFLVWARREPVEPLYELHKESPLRRAGGRPSIFFLPPGTAG